MMSATNFSLFVISILVTLVTSDSPITCETQVQQTSGLGYNENVQIICTCRNSRNSYTGNLNFAKQALSNVQKSNSLQSVDVIIQNCDHLRLELNFNNVGGGQPFNLRISESHSVYIDVVELDLNVMERRQTVVVKNVTYFNMRGTRIQCRICPENTGLLNIQMENVSEVLMTNMTASLPVKLTGRHLEEVRISHSTFSSLPWPGVFLHNATRVEILQNFFLRTKPRSISISLGEIINVSHNLLDVGEALKVEQYEHVIIKCNKQEQGVLLPATCNVPILEYNTRGEDSVKELILHRQQEQDSAGEDLSVSEEIELKIEEEFETIVTVLATVDSFGLVWVVLSVLLIIFFLAFYCCYWRARRGRTEKVAKENLKTAAVLRPDLLVIPFPDDDPDEYSESSRAHLAQGDTFQHRLPQYVRVQGVRCEPGEDGVVCGSLTLGPSFSSQEKSNGTTHSDRTVSSNILKQQAFSKI